MEFRIKLDIPDLPRTGDLVVLDEDVALVIDADGFQRLTAPPNHFEIRTTDGARWVITRRHADIGESSHWFAVCRPNRQGNRVVRRKPQSAVHYACGGCGKVVDDHHYPGWPKYSPPSEMIRQVRDSRVSHWAIYHHCGHFTNYKLPDGWPITGPVAHPPDNVL